MPRLESPTSRSRKRKLRALTHTLHKWLGLTLGLLFTLQAALLFSLIAVAAGRLGGLLARYPGLSCRLERTTGLLFVLLGLHLLFVA